MYTHGLARVDTSQRVERAAHALLLRVCRDALRGLREHRRPEAERRGDACEAFARNAALVVAAETEAVGVALAATRASAARLSRDV